MKFMPEARFYINPPWWRGPMNPIDQKGLGQEQHLTGVGPTKPKDVSEPDVKIKESETEERLGMSIVALIIMVRGG